MSKAPDAFRTISEVADELDVPQHVLRFWETRFNQIKPMKRGGGRRYYRPADVELLKGIKHLLYGEGYTIKGVQKILRDQGAKFVQGLDEEVEIGGETETSESGSTQEVEAGSISRVADDPEPIQATKIEADETSATADLAAPTPTTPKRRLMVAPLPDEPDEEVAESAEDVQDEDEAAGLSGMNGPMDEGTRKALKAALFELAECKRILDGARDVS